MIKETVKLIYFSMEAFSRWWFTAPPDATLTDKMR